MRHATRFTFETDLTFMEGGAILDARTDWLGQGDLSSAWLE